MSQKKRKLQRRVVETAVVKQTEAVIYSEVGMWRVIKSILKKNIWFLIGMSFLAIVVYWNSLWGGFVSDDYASITQNLMINDFGNMFSRGNSMTFGTYFIFKLFGMGSPIPYHVFSLLHLIVFCVIGYVFLEVVFENKWLTRLTMLLFVLHPIHVEAISWISGRIYLILGIYTMIGLLGFVFFVREKNQKYLWVSLLSFALGFLTDKPRPFALVLLIGVYVLAYGIKRVQINWGKVILGSIGVMIVALIVAWPFILTRINIVNSGYNSSESIFYNPFFQYPTGLSKYFQLLWAPFDLTLYHTMYVFPLWLNWSIFIMYFVMLVYFYFKNKAYFFALAFMVAGVLPSIMPVKVSWLVAERYMFLGSFGFCLFLAMIIIDLRRFIKIVTAAVVGCIIAFYGIRVIMRNIDWQTNHNLWVNTCQVSPNSHNAWNNIGDDYDKLAQYDNAIKGFTQSTIVKPNYADAFHNRANIFYKMGRLDLARDSYTTALYFAPQLYQTYLSLIQIDLMEKKIDLALEHAQKAVELQPNDVQSAYVMAVVYAEAGKTVEAQGILEKILKVAPNYQPATQALQQLKALKVATT